MKYRKILLYLCLALFILLCLACKNESQEETVHSRCALSKHSKTAMEAEKPVMRVVLDDKAIAAFTKQKVIAAYCVTMGAS